MSSPGIAADKVIPAPPQYYVLDEPQALSPDGKRRLEYLLVEHDRSTGEQILVTIFGSIEDDEPIAYTNRVFREWKIGTRGRDNGVLIALFWKERKIRLEVGYGLESVLTDAKSKEIIEEIIKPKLRASDADGAMLGAVRAVFETLESPLLTNPESAKYLQTRSGRQRARSSVGSWWYALLFLGLVLSALVWNLVIAAEATFTSAGWTPYRKRFRVRRSGRSIFPGGWGGGGWGGGGWGGGGSGGGFSGGGGRSGGGGASGSW